MAGLYIRINGEREDSYIGGVNAIAVGANASENSIAPKIKRLSFFIIFKS